MAIDFIAKELVTGNADVECLRKLINLEIKKKNKAAKGKNVTGDSTWEDKAEWFRNQMSKKYESGYLTRNTNLFSDNMHIVVFIMSHGFQWYPKRNPVGPLLQFLQDTNTHRISSEGMWFPNPNLTKWVATSPALLSDQSLKEPMFILPSNIKVRTLMRTLGKQANAATQ